jgi:hypothetical protein
LRGVPPDRAQLGVGDRLTGDKPVHRVLVTRVAKLHDDVVDHLGQPRIGQQQLQRVVMVLQAVRFADTDQPVPVEGVQHQVGSLPVGWDQGLTLVNHGALQPATCLVPTRPRPYPGASRSGEPDRPAPNR